MPQAAYSWTDFPTVTVPDPRALVTGPGPLTLHQDGREHQRVGDSGWHMTVCWYAGPTHVVRVRDEPGWHAVHTRVTGAGPDSSHSAPRTEADQDIIEDAANSFLTEAGIPTRLRGFAWFLELPPERPLDELWSLIAEQERTLASHAPSADETATAIETAVHHFYNGPASLHL